MREAQARPLAADRDRRVRRRSLSDDVTKALRDMILAGDLRPEQRITQDDLAATLGVSTMPVREALLKLAHEGLVEASPNRSFRIVRNTRDDVRDIYWTYAAVAGELAARACARQREDPDLLKRLMDHHQAMLAATDAQDTVGMEAANWQFHREINLAGRSPRLLLVVESTLRMIPQHFYALVEDWPRAATKGHVEMLDAFRRGDPEAARHAAMTHAREAGELIVRHFNDLGYWSPPASE